MQDTIYIDDGNYRITYRIKNLRLDSEPPTNLDAVREWVAALRSGKYAQGRGRLRTMNLDGPDQFCCLGVACELAGAPSQYREPTFYYYGEEKNSTMLPKETKEWFGLSGSISTSYATVVDVTQPAWPTSLPHLNDQGATFEQIAKIIAQSWLGEEA